MRRHDFVRLATAGSLGVAAAGCNSSSSSAQPTPTMIPTVGPTAVPGLTLNAGSKVADLRYGISPTPPTFPGYAPAGDAAALIVAGSYTSPATTAVSGTLSTGSYAAGQRYVVKVPDAWNGKLIIAGTPSFRSEFANDAIWGDFALSRGYAFASSNKGIQFNAIVESVKTTTAPTTFFPIPYDLASLETGGLGFRFGVLTQTPRPTIDTWNTDIALLTRAVQTYLATNFGKAPSKTYVVGLSNGGAQVRALLEQHPELVDGGVDWSGVLWTANHNILSYLPTFLANMPKYVASGFTDTASAAAIVAAGFPADITQSSSTHPSLWYEYYSGQASFYADLTLFAYSLLIDPNVSSNATGTCTPNSTNPAQLPGTCTGSGMALPATRQTYQPSAGAFANIGTFAHTGNIGKPLVSIAGSADMFITAPHNAKPYLDLVNGNGKSSMYRQYIVQGGTHVDSFVPFGYGLQAQLPFAWAAFDQMVAMVEKGYNPSGAGVQTAVSSPAQIASS